MPTPAVTLKLRRFRRRFGITAPRVAVRTHIPWQWYAAGMLALTLAITAIAWSIAQRGEKAQLQQEIGRLEDRLKLAAQELQELRAAVGTEQSGVQMERSAKQQLHSRVKLLEGENASLKEDIAFFERLVPPAGGAEAAVRIERLRVVAEAEPERYRYRLLVGFVANKQVKDFKGRLQLAISYSLAGRDQLMTLPGGHESPPEYGIEVRHFLRKEGVFALPAGAKLRGVEARILQSDTLKAKRSAQL